MKRDVLDPGTAPHTEGIVLHSPRLYDLLLRPRAFGRGTLVDLAAPRAGRRALDVGCGTGAVTLLLQAQARDCRVTGIDASPQMIARAQAKARKRGLGTEFRVAVVEDLPFPDGSFDLVVSSLMLHHLPDDLKPRAFAEIRRVLRADGTFLALDLAAGGHRRGGHFRIPWRTPRGDAYFERLRPLMEKARLTDVEQLPTRRRRFLYLRARRAARNR